MDFQNRAIDARAFALPKIASSEGKNLIPVVTAIHQGRSLAGMGGDGDLSPAGVGVKQMSVGGADSLRDNADFWKTGGSGAREEDKVFPQRIIILLDVSPSMSGYKLDLVKQKIKDLKQILDDQNIETLVLPYNSELENLTEHQDADSVLKRVSSLSTSGGTDIYKPVDEVFNILKNKNDDKRNLVLLVSDGQHGSGEKHDQDIVDRAKAYPEIDVGVYTVGVSAGYNEELMRGIAEAVGFGGSVHIPELTGKPEVFKTLLPRFIKGISSAPHFPILKFNQWFDKVINLTPSMKTVQKASDGFKASQGYQLDSYAVAFIDEDKFNSGNAKIELELKDKASDKQNIDEWEIEIEDFDQAILDPSEREMIKDMPTNALQAELMKARDVQALQDLVRLNQHNWDAQTRRSFADAAGTVSRVMSGELDENTFRGAVSDANSIVGSQSYGNTQAGLGSRDYTIPVNPAALRHELIPAKTYRVLVAKGGPRATVNNSNPAWLLKMNEGDVKKIGRGENSDIVISSASASKNHAELKLEDGQLHVKDLNSTNGTFINGVKIVDSNFHLITNEDRVTFGPAIIKFMEDEV